MRKRANAGQAPPPGPVRHPPPGPLTCCRMTEGVSLSEAVGGMPFFEGLVGDFYTGVAGDVAGAATHSWGTS